MSPPDSQDGAGERPRPRAGAATNKALLFAALKWLLLAVVFFFVGRELLRQFGKMSWDQFHPAPGFLAAAILVMAAANALTFLYYHLLLVRFGHAPPWRAMMPIVWVAQTAKYVPGKVGSVIGITVLLRRHGVPGQVAVSTVIINDGLSIVVGLVAAMLLSLWGPVREELPMLWAGCAALAVVGGACLHPRVFRAVSGVLLRQLGHKTFPTFPRLRDYLPSLLAMLGHFGLLGLSYWLAARAMADVPASQLPLFVTVAVTVTIAGFVAFFAPAGLGVQEGLLLIILPLLIGSDNAAVLVVLMRLMRTATEALLALAGLAILRFHPPGT